MGFESSCPGGGPVLPDITLMAAIAEKPLYAAVTRYSPGLFAVKEFPGDQTASPVTSLVLPSSKVATAERVSAWPILIWLVCGEIRNAVKVFVTVTVAVPEIPL